MKLFPRAVLLLLPLLAACTDGNVADTLGLNRSAPDEFTVVSRPSLAVPPEFNLRPPVPGAPPRAPSAEATARGLVLGQPAEPQETIDTIVEPTGATAVTPVVRREGTSQAAEAFLSKAGADKASDTIRTQLGADATTPVDTSKATSLYEKMTGAAKNEPVVDAKKEAERLRANKDEGKAVNEGDVPVEPVKPPSVVDRIF